MIHIFNYLVNLGRNMLAEVHRVDGDVFIVVIMRTLSMPFGVVKQQIKFEEEF